MLLSAFAFAALASGCDALGSVAVDATDFAGAKADAYCDRRFVTTGGKPEAFCQEIVETLAASEFADDCRSKHRATAAPGRCARERIIAGCKLQKINDDESEVWDWYYDVHDIVADAGADASAASFEKPPTSVEDVRKLCADRERYEDGAELVLP